MRIRPYPAWGLLASVLAISAWRLYERPGGEYSVTRPARCALGVAGATDSRGVRPGPAAPL